MMFWFFSSMFGALIMTLPLCNTPISLGLWIWLMALTLAILLSFFSLSWFALMLFLIYIGGLLVMFAYFSAITPNQKMFMKQLFLSLIPPLCLLGSLSFKQTIFTMTLPSIKFSAPVILINSMSILSILALILFIVMVAVAKTAKPKFGPLRPFILD